MRPPLLIDLSDRTILLFRGADRVRFLNGQLSNDVRKLRPGMVMHACVMTAKGKMNADVWLTLDGETIRVDAPPGLGEDLLARFERYLIADDVIIEDVTGQTPFFHLAGAETNVANRFRLPGQDFFGENPPDFPILTSEQAESFRIEQGVPAWGAELGDDTIPVEAGLEHDAIDYHKGCYLGQEVISRIKSVGHVNRQLVRLSGPAGLDLPPGAVLFAGETEAGRVTSSASSLDLEKTVALAYLKRASLGSTLTRPAALTIHPLIP